MKLTKKIKAEIVELVLEGFKSSEIVKLTGVSVTSVNKIKREIYEI